MNRLLPSTHLVGSHRVRISYVRPLFDQMVNISDPKQVYHLIKPQMTGQLDYKESFWVLFLTRASRLLDISKVGCGDVKQTVINVPEIFQLGLLLNASSIILVHNHPSGNLSPSKSDLSMTESIKQGCKHVGLTLLDHLIITSEGFLSMASENMF